MFKFDGLRSGYAIEEFYKRIGKENNIDKIQDVKIPLGIVATDLKREKEVWFTSRKIDDNSYGNVLRNKINIIDVNIGKVIRASSSYSVIFDPCFIGEDVYIDGGVFNSTPVDLAKALGAEKVLAINFEENNPLDIKHLNVVNIGLKTIDMMSRVISNKSAEEADVVVWVKSQSDNLLDVNNSEKYFMAGYIAMKNKMKELKKALEFS